MGKISRFTGEAYKLFLIKYRGIEVGKHVRFFGVPQINCTGRIVLGDDVVLNSTNEGYHANMACSVKLMADRDGAEIVIGARTRVNGACIHAWHRVTIGADCLIAAGVQIIDANGHELDPAMPRNRTQDKPRCIEIGDDVWLGVNAIVLPGTTIGERSVIGANSVVRGTIPSSSLVVGNPAKIVRVLSNNTVFDVGVQD